MSASTYTMNSVGIDVGTTTTQCVFSRLQLRDTSRPGGVPRIQVTEREILYQGPVLLSPLLGPEEINADRLVSLIEAEYASAGMTPSDVETGAVIITGEIARTKNADIMLDRLGAFAGDFVVTVAGPNVEAQIAARGSGAAAYSETNYTQVTNLDIGGGTTNAAVFRAGRHIGSSAVNVGGRQVVLDPTSARVTAIAPGAGHIIESLGLPLRIGEPAGLDALRQLCSAMADVVVTLAGGRKSDLAAELALTGPLPEADTSRRLFLSGGVAHYYYHPVAVDSLSQVLVHGDVGPLFAHELRTHQGLPHERVLEPKETIRATVLGAASQTITLSGSTIWAAPGKLPLRNLAVIDPQVDENRWSDGTYLRERFRAALERWDMGPGSGPPAALNGSIGAPDGTRFALVLNLPPRLRYDTLREAAAAISEFAQPELLGGNPLVLILEHDYAQVVGQTLSGLRPELSLVSVDQVGLGEGDFIDIGRPVLGGRVVPLSIKTLIFYE